MKYYYNSFYKSVRAFSTVIQKKNTCLRYLGRLRFQFSHNENTKSLCNAEIDDGLKYDYDITSKILEIFSMK